MTRSVKLLLIDENDAERALILRHLRTGASGLEAREAWCADSLARALEAPRYDLAIVEHRLSWSSGLKVGGIIRERYPDCPLLMCARDPSMEAAVEALKSGFDDYLPKSPERISQLSRLMDDLLERARVRRRETFTETRLQDLLVRLNVGVYRATSRGVMLYANPAFCRIFGIASWKDAPTWSLRAAMADQGDEARITKELKGAGCLQDFEVRLNGPGGRIQWISLTQTLRPGREGLGVIEGLVEDITERKLQSIAARRKEENLQQSRRLDTVGRLAGGVAHDFNNLLTAIYGYSDLLLANFEDDHPLRDNVVEIRKAGVRAAMLTRQLLAFSSRLMLQPRSMDLNAMLRRMETIIKDKLGESIRIETQAAPDLGPIHADPAQLENVVMSLIHNAQDAMPMGGMVRIRTWAVNVSEEEWRRGWDANSADRLKAGPYALLQIEDNGSGMPPEILDRIFEPFFTTKSMGEGPLPGRTGTGMGLSSAYGIVKQTGGTIHIDSVPGNGTRVRIYLPLDTSEEIQPLQETRGITGEGRN